MWATTTSDSAAPPDDPPQDRVIDRRLFAALGAAFLWHGGLVLSGSYGRTYDAWIHQFFADHYARDWFSTWETRWYTGFTVTSYPPGSHQTMALLSSVFGLEGAFMIVQISAVLGLVLGVWRFSQIWVGPTAAAYAAGLCVVSTSLAEVVHVFGQLPTSFSLALLLNTLPSIHKWVLGGDWRQGLVAVAGLAATTAGHHVTTLFGAVFFVGPVIVTALIDAIRTPHRDEYEDGVLVTSTVRLTRSTLVAAIARRLRRVAPAIVRSGMISVAAIIVLAGVVLPYWLWSSSDPIVQIPIPHASRDNFLVNRPAGLVFFVVPWGASILLLPFAALRGTFSRGLPLAASVVLLFVLGTGGTTPIPRLLLRGAFDILTLDRFTIWSTIAVLPLSGAVVASFASGRLGRVVTAQLGGTIKKLIGAGFVAALLAGAVLGANFATFRPLQPDPIDPVPIANFMQKDQHDRWRYLTLGFGDQMARISAETTATTVDGNYHSARRLPELTSRSVERLEGAKFRGVPGLGSLQQFLATPERYNLKFVFSNDVFYDPLLWGSGWHRLDRLDNGIVVWEREDIPPLPDVLPVRELPTWQRLLWGIVPMTALSVAATAFTWLATGLRVPSVPKRLARSGPASQGWRFNPIRVVDRRLAALATTTDEGGAPPRVHAIIERADQLLEALMERRADSTRLFRVVAILGVLVVLGGAVVTVRSTGALASSPAAAVEAFYDDLDFRRFDKAHARLDTQTRPSFDQFLLELSVADGLVDSYGKLDSIVTTTTADDGDTATVVADLSFLTSISQHQVTVEHELRWSEGVWQLQPQPSDLSTTDRQFSRSTEVEYFQQGRRQVTVEQTSFGDVLDRPRTEVLSAQAVERDGFFSVVGEITNLDVDPADLTITARFYDADDNVLVDHNAALVTVHKVLPRETVPFRIDLEAIAGEYDALDEAAGDFHPELFAAPPINRNDIARIELATKAVVTGRDLQRSVQAQNIRVAQSSDGAWFLTGELWNSGSSTATIPHVLVTLMDQDGNVAWVDHVWVDRAVRPERSVVFSVPLTSASSITNLTNPMSIQGNGVIDGQEIAFTDLSAVDLPVESGFDEAKVTVVAFYRDPTA